VANGTAAHGIVPPLSLRGPALTIRGVLAGPDPLSVIGEVATPLSAPDAVDA
jgi:hypothetical protein